MFPYGAAPEESTVRPLADEDQQLLLGLVHKYGASSVLYALTGYGEPSRASAFSANTLLSSASASSIAWTNSEAASQCRSDEASIHTSYTWPDVQNDIQPVHEAEANKGTERSWLDSPVAVPSPMIQPHDVTSHPSPRLVTPTSKKYQCHMCYLDNSPVGFGRKSDFKKHLHNFHGADVVWICRTKGCHLSFSTERAYGTHAKEAHRMKALPNSAARTEMCPQLVFACGFGNCRDRLFEAHNAEDASATRDKHFEHIAKHFEDGFDVANWEYRVQVQNLMRQKQVKQVWKTCVWPKEKRQQLHWRARSSGDLKRILECRHLGTNISSLVRLAFILGTPPFTTNTTPPPNEIDAYFQLPYRSQCLLETSGHSTLPSTASKPEEEDSPTLSVPKSRSGITSIPHTMLKLSTRSLKRGTRPSTPASVMSNGGDTIMGDDLAAGPHPGTPFPIPNETVWPADAPKFAPDIPTSMPKQADTPLFDHQQLQHPQHPQQQLMYTMPPQDPSQQAWMAMDQHIPAFQTQQQIFPDQPDMMNGLYDYSMNTSQASTMRPATPTPHKRPASWSRMISMENLRPAKKSTADTPPPGMIMGM
ncbi:hypothetical protein TRIATDRAFT_214001 [Trichoderma atroviride IMI 206040]|uniref:C2H2-type domain-containing protein n=1 Tax=Hypocrea atroviridis (strain ATCC 20476 / IMI 206040) TaxID=452589 RepID=G9NJW1_HYPAI|nr:uncharacterized protein TRIATDRAFT_214001 [Trichoderma atroviride IMI 206040]EHK49183.1 hypothetical protein TRIATDRAFT_214001 [Trichoderma atroviride IMI 206040]